MVTTCKMPTNMRAMVLPRFGGAELFELRDVEKPQPAPGEVLVKVIASAVNPVDAKIRAGGTWAKIQLPAILGYDAAGIIEEVGIGVTNLKPGDEVYYTPEIFENSRGTYAEYNVVSANIVAKKPKNLSFEQAAAIPLAGGSAWEALVRRLKVRLGETVLIHGAAGGVGSFAVQFAKHAGAKVLATSSSHHLGFLKQLGADVAIDYNSEDVTQIALDETEGIGVDAALDIEGPDLVARCLKAVRPFGRIAAILSPQGDLSRLYMKNITFYGVFLTRERKRLDEMRPLFEREQVRAIVDQVLPLEEVKKAHERMDTRHGRGKVVLRIAL